MATSKERRDRIASLTSEVASLRADKDARHDGLTNAQERAITDTIKGKQAEIVSLITEGAEPCPHCGAKPHGMMQPIDAKKGGAAFVYEIGCLGSRAPLPGATGELHPQTRAIDLLPELAVEKWNEERFEPESDGPGVVLASEA